MFEVSMEMIRFQAGDPFPDKLSDVISDIFLNIDNGKYSNIRKVHEGPEVRLIEEMIKSRFNLTVRFDWKFAKYAVAAIFPFSGQVVNRMTNKNDSKRKFDLSLFTAWTGFGNVRKIMKGIENDSARSHGKEGRIDLKNAYLKGYMAEVEHVVGIDFVSLNTLRKLTPKEVAAIIVHELGHAFTGLERHHSLVSTNEAIGTVIRAINESTPTEAIKIYQHEFGVDDLIESGLSTTSTPNDFYGALARQYLPFLDSQYGDGKHDETAFEQMADAFAVNMGLGKELATALTKLSNGGIDNRNKLMGAHLLRTLQTIIEYCAVIVGGNYLLAFFLTLVKIAFGSLESVTYRPHGYSVDRIERISRDLIHALKDTDLPKEQVAIAIRDFETISEIAEYTLSDETFFNKMAQLVIPSLRKSRWYRKNQQAIEKLLNNPLFVTSSKLNQLGE